jgi:hypothetical protein
LEMSEIAVTTEGFVDDVKASLAAWGKAPLLPVVATVIGLISVFDVRPEFGYWTPAIIVLVGFFAAGWLGTELTWYRRTFSGLPFKRGELIPLTWTFIARYVWLLSLAVIPLVVAGLALVATRSFSLDSLNSPAGHGTLLAYFLVVGMVGTFMIPALAFTTRRVTKAIQIGLRLLTHGWSGNWTYVVVPAVIAAVLGGIYWLVPGLGRPVIDIIISLAELLFAGAIARYYLRTTTTGSL